MEPFAFLLLGLMVVQLLIFWRVCYLLVNRPVSSINAPKLEHISGPEGMEVVSTLIVVMFANKHGCAFRLRDPTAADSSVINTHKILPIVAFLMGQCARRHTGGFEAGLDELNRRAMDLMQGELDG